MGSRLVRCDGCGVDWSLPDVVETFGCRCGHITQLGPWNNLATDKNPLAQQAQPPLPPAPPLQSVYAAPELDVERVWKAVVDSARGTGA